jgi:hypothetical protein
VSSPQITFSTVETIDRNPPNPRQSCLFTHPCKPKINPRRGENSPPPIR